MELDLLEKARLTFAATAIYHFLFVPLTIGLTGTVAILKAIAIFKSDSKTQQFLDMLMPIFLINFVCGMVTGFPLRLLIKNEWSFHHELSANVFKSVFSFEHTLLPVSLILAFLYVFSRKWAPKIQVLIIGMLCMCLMV